MVENISLIVDILSPITIAVTFYIAGLFTGMRKELQRQNRATANRIRTMIKERQCLSAKRS